MSFTFKIVSLAVKRVFIQFRRVTLGNTFLSVTRQTGGRFTFLVAVGRLVGPKGVFVPENFPTLITHLGGVALAFMCLLNVLSEPFQIFVTFIAFRTLFIFFPATGCLVPCEAPPIVKLSATKITFSRFTNSMGIILMHLLLSKILILPIAIRDTASGSLNIKMSCLDVLFFGRFTVKGFATSATRKFETSMLVHMIIKVMFSVSGVTTAAAYIFFRRARGNNSSRRCWLELGERDRNSY